MSASGRIDSFAKLSGNDGYLRLLFVHCGLTLGRRFGRTPIALKSGKSDERSGDLGAPRPCFRPWKLPLQLKGRPRQKRLAFRSKGSIGVVVRRRAMSA